MTNDQIIKAGRILKVLKLANEPGMDEVAIKLNCGLTYREEREAKYWAAAFELAQTKKSIFQLAMELRARRI